MSLNTQVDLINYKEPVCICNHCGKLHKLIATIVINCIPVEDVPNSVSFSDNNVLSFNKSKMKAKLKKMNVVSDDILLKELSKSSLNLSLLDVDEEDLKQFVDNNSGKLINSLEKWL